MAQKPFELSPAEADEISRIVGIEPHRREESDLLRIVELTSAVPFFEQLHDDALHLECCRFLRYRFINAKKTIFRQGDVGDNFYIMLSGAVKIHVILNAKTGQTFEKVLTSGAFGEVALLNDAPRNASVLTVEDSELLFLTKEDYKQLLEAHEARLNAQKVEFLRKNVALSVWPKEFLTQLTFVMKEQTFEAASTIIEEGTVPEMLALVYSGQANLTRVVEKSTSEHALITCYGSIAATSLKNEEVFESTTIRLWNFLRRAVSLMRLRQVLEDLAGADYTCNKVVGHLGFADVVGELSVLSGFKVVSSCVAVTKVTLMTIRKDDFEQKLAELPDRGAMLKKSAQLRAICMKDPFIRVPEDITALVLATKGSKFFSNLNPVLHRNLCGDLTYQSVAKGDCIFREGDVAHYLYFIIGGSVEISSTSRIKVEVLNKGVFGEQALGSSDNIKRTITATAGPGLELVRLHRGAYISRLKGGDEQSHRKKMKILSECSIFENMEPILFKKMGDTFASKSFLKNAVLTREGHVATQIFLLVTGMCVIRKNFVGRESQAQQEFSAKASAEWNRRSLALRTTTVDVAYLVAGEVFGEDSLSMEERLHEFSVAVASDTAVFYVGERAELLPFLVTRPEVAESIVNKHCMRADFVHRRAAEIARVQKQTRDLRHLRQAPFPLQTNFRKSLYERTVAERVNRQPLYLSRAGVEAHHRDSGPSVVKRALPPEIMQPHPCEHDFSRNMQKVHNVLAAMHPSSTLAHVEPAYAWYTEPRGPKSVMPEPKSNILGGERVEWLLSKPDIREWEAVAVHQHLLPAMEDAASQRKRDACFFISPQRHLPYMDDLGRKAAESLPWQLNAKSRDKQQRQEAQQSALDRQFALAAERQDRLFKKQAANTKELALRDQLSNTLGLHKPRAERKLENELRPVDLIQTRPHSLPEFGSRNPTAVPLRLKNIPDGSPLRVVRHVETFSRPVYR